MIVIPMAGLSKRFFKEGYKSPKYMLRAGDKTLFEHAVLSFEAFFAKEKFLFVGLHDQNAYQFINEKAKDLGIHDYKIVMLAEPTHGQAETVFLGLREARVYADEPLLIFNIDTIRPNFELPSKFSLDSIDGYLETFIGSGSNWSNILPFDEIEQTVKLTAEKQEISQYCCTGIYYWARTEDFIRIFEIYRATSVKKLQGSEYYIAPMYNYLISENKDVRYSVVDEASVIFCGVPGELEAFRRSISNEI